MFITRLIKKSPRLRNLVERLTRFRTVETVNKFDSFLNKEDRILDLGSGLCALVHEMIVRGFDMTPVDVSNISLYPDIVPQIYDGINLPFKDNSFDAVTVITVIHHTPDPEVILKECMRVGKRIVIVEDTYNNRFEQLYTYFMDSLLNLEFFGHPHSNKSDLEWKALFQKYKLKLVSEHHHKFFGFCNSSTYILDKK